MIKPSVSLKPQDLVITLKIVSLRRQNSPIWTYRSLAESLDIGEAEAHRGLKRSLHARLVDIELNPLSSALLEFIVHGVKYAFPPERGSLTRGMPTAYLAMPLREHIMASDEPGPVWPEPEGTVKGYSFTPLYPSVPKAALNDPVLYELLALTDALRDGRVRERQLAQTLLKERLSF